MTRPSPSDDFQRSWLYVGGAIAALSISVAVARIMTPLLPLLVPLGCGGWAWWRYQRHQRQSQAALDGVFYDLLRQYQGRMMVLDFAIASQRPAAVAQEYLDAKAREFSARYEVTQTGDIFYVFPTLQLPAAEFQDRFSALAADLLPLNQTQLAQRLGVSSDTIRRRKHLPDWRQWSQEKDPAQISWSYRRETQRFVPTHDPMNDSEPPTEGST
jgi:hypothetical protein